MIASHPRAASRHRAEVEVGIAPASRVMRWYIVHRDAHAEPKSPRRPVASAIR